VGLYKCITTGGKYKFTRDISLCEKPVQIYDDKELVMISKLISRILRHEPHKYNVNIDEYGWVQLDELVKALKKTVQKEVEVSKESVLGIIMTDPKSRFEYRNGKVRARYGHSINVKIEYEEVTPRILYHGTQKDKLKSILIDGLVPGNRLYVHLSPTPDEACLVARRRRGIPIYLVIDACKLIELGYKIYKATHRIYLVKKVPPSAIREYHDCT
jgi:putative RNA 2'-phosphotransferase